MQALCLKRQWGNQIKNKLNGLDQEQVLFFNFKFCVYEAHDQKMLSYAL